MEKSTRKGNDEKTKDEFIKTIKHHFVFMLIILFCSGRSLDKDRRLMPFRR